MFMRVAALLLMFVLPSSAEAEQRIALLIGNKDYKASVGALVNPLNDVRIVGAALAKVGFEVLGPIQNARRADILIAVNAFAARLKAAGPDAIGFVYYSGHGMAAEGENYLIPVDIDEPSPEQLRVHGVKQSEILSTLRYEAPNAAHYLVLDACRNTLKVGKGAGRGFITVGQQSGVSDLIMFHNVRIAVIRKTGREQVPWTEDGIERPVRVEFGSRIPREVSSHEREARDAWNDIKTTTNSIVLEKFIASNGDTIYGPLARARIEELKKAGSRDVRCPDIVGKWTSWASFLFGSGDTSFKQDGTWIHPISGDGGKWWCEGDQLRILKPGGKVERYRFSRDAKQIIGIEPYHDIVIFSRN
jgi:Caspase domain